MPSISTVATALPENRYTREQIVAAGSKWLEQFPDDRDAFIRFVQRSRIDTRHFALPIERVLGMTGAAARAECFLKEGRKLGRAAMASALASANVSPKDIGCVVFTSCSVPTIPSLETLIMQDLEFPPTTTRVPLFQYGCAGGASGLSLATRLAREGAPALLISVELCSLIYQGLDRSRGNLVGSALFADGAACVVVSGGEGPGLRHLASQTFILRESTHLMGYDILDDGAHLRLDKDLPRRLSLEVPGIVDSFLKSNHINPSEISSWLFHPGGVRILEELERLFDLDRSQTRWSWDALQRYGNMSSASILFVLDHFIRDVPNPHGKVLMLGIGPGLVVELLLFEGGKSCA